MRRPGRKRSRPLCVFCRDALAHDGWRCPDCGVLVHARCAQELRGARCPTLGCASARAWEWTEPPSRWDRFPRRWMAAALVLWVSAAIAGTNLLAAAQAPPRIMLPPAARPAPSPTPQPALFVEPVDLDEAPLSPWVPKLETLELAGGGCAGHYCGIARLRAVWRIRRGDDPPREVSHVLPRSDLERALWRRADGDVSRVSVLAGVFRATCVRSQRDLGRGCFGEPLGQETWESWTSPGLPFPVYEVARVRASPERLYSPLVDQITELVRIE